MSLLLLFTGTVAVSAPSTSGTRAADPNPIGPLFPIALRTHTHSVNLNLLGQDQFFGLAGHPNYDWPNPRGYQHPISNRSHTDGWRVNLFGRDTVYGAPGQVGPNYDWPLPQGHLPQLRVPPVLRMGHLDPMKLPLRSQDAFFGVAGNPQRDWPVPKGYQHPISNRTHLDPLKLTLRGQDKFFGLAGHPTYDWPVPKGYIYPVSLRMHLVPFLEYIFPIPFHMTDWPVPKGYIYPSHLRIFTDPLKLNLRGKDFFFGLAGHPNYDWPNPRGPAYPPSLRVDYTTKFMWQADAEAEASDAFNNPPGFRRPLRIRGSGSLSGTYWRGRAR